MEKTFSIVLIGLALLLSRPAGAQHFDAGHRHAIELSTGYPPLHGSLGFDANLLRSRGIESKLLFRPSVNLGYTFSITELWDFNMIFNYCTSIYRMSRREPEPGMAWKEYYHAFSLMADARIKWFRTDLIRLYSAFGAGVTYAAESILPAFYITPVGINIGKGHLYGVVEVNVSSAATFFLAGAGWRF